MKRKAIVLLLLLLLGVCGCRPTVMEYGVEYEALTMQERDALISLARATLAHNSKRGIITLEENRIAHEKEPDFLIHYNGDRQGTAKVKWGMPARWITIVFEGEFLTPQMNYILQIQEKGPDVIDMRQKSKIPEKQKPEKTSKKKWYRSIAAPSE